ncbi:MAG: hypothetical protein WC683_02390 [bacterium]
MDADRITGNLWVGSAPPPSTGLRQKFDVLVLCAEEYQPKSYNFPGVTVVHAGFDDTQELSRKDKQVVQSAAYLVRQALDRNMRVLVTCHAGLNRSALVAGLALRLPGRGRSTPSCMNGDEVVHLLKSRRDPNALMNPLFQKIVRRAQVCR